MGGDGSAQGRQTPLTHVVPARHVTPAQQFLFVIDSEQQPLPLGYV